MKKPKKKFQFSISQDFRSMDQKLKTLRELQKKELELIQEIQELKVSEITENTLNNEEIGRYSRQLLLPEWGVKTQVNISKKTKGVLVQEHGRGKNFEKEFVLND